MTKSYTPILVGVAQYTQPKHTTSPLDPLGLMAHVCRDALADAGGVKLKELIDTLYVVNLFQWTYRDAPGMLCNVLGISPERSYYTPIGGNTPQLLVHKAARDLASGRRRAVLLTGAEAIYSLRRSLKGDIVLDWTPSESPERIDGDDPPGVNHFEASYDLYLPSYVYPIFETAIRASYGRSPEQHREYMGRLWEHFSLIASKNSHAWSREKLSAQDIAEVTSDNRYIGYPYTKSMNANINVDQSAALILTTQETAQECGIDPSRWVYPLGGADFHDIWNFSQRPRLDNSPAIRNAAQVALDQAELTLNEIDVFDLYSCFPSAVEIARAEIGIAEDDPRELSVTGGLAFFGGAGNNYSMHAIASVVERIRHDRSLKAMVTANGWYITKHSIGIYGGTPPKTPWKDSDGSSIQRAISDEALPEPVEKADGSLCVEGYVVRHDRHGQPEKGTVIGRLTDGKRALAHIDAKPGTLLKMEEVELVGRTGEVRFDQGVMRNLVRFPEFS
ncbi:MAG TPA: acetyl-CoA acetyltransferase [Deltaproteobacteria bacterium]|nr:acetyl-CoA acetyltransferase [Deltaproteobacteria bacterium]